MATYLPESRLQSLFVVIGFDQQRLKGYASRNMVWCKGLHLTA